MRQEPRPYCIHPPRTAACLKRWKICSWCWPRRPGHERAASQCARRARPWSVPSQQYSAGNALAAIWQEKNGLSNEELEEATESSPFQRCRSPRNWHRRCSSCYEWSSTAPDIAAADPDAAAKAKEEEELRRAPWAARLHVRVGRSPVGIEFRGGRGVYSTYGSKQGAEQKGACLLGNEQARLILRGEPTLSEASLLRGSLQSLAGRYGRRREEGRSKERGATDFVVYEAAMDARFRAQAPCATIVCVA